MGDIRVFSEGLDKFTDYDSYNEIKTQSFPIWIRKLSESNNQYEEELSQRIMLISNHEPSEENVNNTLEQISKCVELSKVDGKDYYIVFGYDIGHKNVIVIQGGQVALFDSIFDGYGNAEKLREFFIDGIYPRLQEMDYYIDRKPETIQFDNVSCSVFTVYMIKFLSKYFRQGGNLVKLNKYTKLNQKLLFSQIFQSLSKKKELDRLIKGFLLKLIKTTI